MSTIRDVARMAGVSVATVSRVLNESSSVSAEKRETVMRAIKRLNYQPNMLGRNLRRTETRMVLVLLPSISNPFYARIVNGIEDVAHKNGYNIMLCNTGSDISREKVYLEMLKKRLSDGVILMAPELSREELDEIGRRHPVVQCCEYREGSQVSHVSVDNYAAARKVVRHLTGLGHRRIGLISCKNSFVSIKQREQGYLKGLEEAGITPDAGLVKYGDYGYASGIRAANQLLSGKNRPTAVFAISDVMAAGVLKAARERGLRIPEDIAVVGFDNINISYMCNPMLSTVSQPKYDMGRVAMDLLIRHMTGAQKKAENICLEHELVIRESTVGQ